MMAVNLILNLIDRIVNILFIITLNNEKYETVYA